MRPWLSVCVRTWSGSRWGVRVRVRAGVRVRVRVGVVGAGMRLAG